MTWERPGHHPRSSHVFLVKWAAPLVGCGTSDAEEITNLECSTPAPSGSSRYIHPLIGMPLPFVVSVSIHRPCAL